MEQLIYVSTASEDLEPGVVFDIVQQAARNNAERDITGALIFLHGRFLQVIEGDRDEVDLLLGRLERDPRHHTITIIQKSQIVERQFPGWHMRRFRVSDPGEAKDEFRRLLAHHKDARRMFEDFARYLAPASA